jgi:hypothetical protein
MGDIEDILFSPIEPERLTIEPEGKFDGIAIAKKYNCTRQTGISPPYCYWDKSRLCEKAMRCVDVNVDATCDPTPKFK